MYWTIHCLDKPNTSEVRQRVLGAHLAYVASASLHVVLAGPLLGETGSSPSGSLLIVEADQISEVEAFAIGAPFAAAGLWDSIRIDAFAPTPHWPATSTERGQMP